jgi:hypothetical protein
LDEISIQHERCSEITVGLLLFANSVYELDFERQNEVCKPTFIDGPQWVVLKVGRL